MVERKVSTVELGPQELGKRVSSEHKGWEFREGQIQLRINVTVLAGWIECGSEDGRALDLIPVKGT